MTAIITQARGRRKVEEEQEQLEQERIQRSREDVKNTYEEIRKREHARGVAAGITISIGALIYVASLIVSAFTSFYSLNGNTVQLNSNALITLGVLTGVGVLTVVGGLLALQPSLININTIMVNFIALILGFIAVIIFSGPLVTSRNTASYDYLGVDRDQIANNSFDTGTKEVGEPNVFDGGVGTVTLNNGNTLSYTLINDGTGSFTITKVDN